MKNKSPTPTGKRITTFVILTQLILASGLLPLTLGFSSKEEARVMNAYAASQAVSVSEATLAKTNDFLIYLKRLDTEAGRKAFDATVLDAQMEKESLQRLRENLVTLVTENTKLHSRVSRWKAENTFTHPLLSSPLETPSFLDLGRRLTKELQVDALLTRESSLNQALAKLLGSNAALWNLSAIGTLSSAEQEILGLLQKNNLESTLPLLARLRFDASMTDFWLNYATTGSSLLEQSNANATQDATFLDEKASKEQGVLDLIQTLYPAEGDQQAQLLADDALDLFRSYEKEDVALKIQNLQQSVAILDQVTSDLNATASFDAFGDLSRHTRILVDLLNSLKAEPFSSTLFEAKSQEYLDLATPVSQQDLASDDFMRRQWKTLENFEKLLPLGDVALHTASLDEERAAAVLTDNVEHLLKRQLSKVLNPPPVEAPVEAPAQPSPETSAPEAAAPDESLKEAAPQSEAPILVPVEAPVAPVSEPVSAPSDLFANEVGNQLSLLQPVMDLIQIVTSPTDALLNLAVPTGSAPTEPPLAPSEPSVQPSDSTPTSVAPVEPLKEAAPSVSSTETETVPTTEETTPIAQPEVPAPAPEVTTPVAQPMETPAPTVAPTETPAPVAPSTETPAPVPEVSVPETPPVSQGSTLPEQISQGIQDFFGDALAVSSAIAEDDGIKTVDLALLSIEKTEAMSLTVRGLLEKVDALKVQPQAFQKVLDGLTLSPDQQDALLSFLNQTTLKLGLLGEAAGFAGVNGVLRFGEDSCPDLAKIKTLAPEDEREDFSSLSFDRQRDALLKEKENESDPAYLRLKTLRKLGVDFCFAVSDDISSKNLIGRPDALLQPSDSVLSDHSNLSLRFDNDPFRTLTMTVGSAGDSSRTLVLRHLASENSAILVPALQKKVDAAIQDAVQNSVGPIIKVETPANVSAALNEGLGDSSAYGLSSLSTPFQLLVTPIGVDQREAFQRVATYEQNNHRKNSVTLFTDDAHLIVPRHVDEHLIYNYGNGLENETFAFQNAVLRALPDGTIEGYLFDPVAVRQNLQASAGDTPLTETEIQSRLQAIISKIHTEGMATPDFVLAQPFALDRNSNLIDGLGYDITGDSFNQLSVILNVDPTLYPIVLNAKLSLTSPGQTSYGRILQENDASGNRFGSSVTIGDFNGDGKKDVAVGSPTADGNRGRVSMYYSTDVLSVPEGEPDLVIDGEPLSLFGSRLWSGDLNNDGIDTLVVGSPWFDQNRGRAWIFHKALATVKEAHAVLSSDKADLTVTGSGGNDEFGSSLAIADLTGDGKNDLAIASPGAQNDKGSVYLYDNDAVVHGGTLNSEESAFKFSGEGSGRFGASLATLDFDHDGTTDLAIGAPAYGSSVNPDLGRAYVFFQDATPWTHHETLCKRNCSAENADLILEGESAGSRFGAALASEDLNNDSLDDLAVSADHFSLTDSTQEGRVYVFVNKPDFQLVEAAKPAREADLKITGDSGERLGSPLSTFKSANDSGFAIGSQACDGGAGCVTIYSTAALTQLITVDNGFTNAVATHTLKWEGLPLSRFGESLAAQDLTGDGLTDFVFGAPGIRDFSGAAYLFIGKPFPIEASASAPLGSHRPNETIPPEETKPAAEEAKEEIPPTEVTPPEFSLQLQDITDAVQETAKTGFALDVTVPEIPVISCPRFESGSSSRLAAATCSWSSTAGPSAGTYLYCVDTENQCQPSTESPNRVAEIGQLVSSHTYLRVQTADLGGTSPIASFDLKANHAPVFTQGPSDNGSDESQPTLESRDLRFTATAEDAEGDSTVLVICRTSDQPIYNDKGEPVCAGNARNLICASRPAKSGAEASCMVVSKDEPLTTLIWYAFACDLNSEAGFCSPLSQGEGLTGSPAFIQHPQAFGAVEVTNLEDQAINPGDRLRFTLKKGSVENVDLGKTITMFICSADTTVFDYQTNECVGGTLICASSEVNPRTQNAVCEDRNGVSPVPVPTPVGPAHFHVFVKHGERGIAEGDHTQEYQVANIAPTLISTTNEGAITVSGGGSAKVSFSAVVRDENGAQDILGAKGVFFDADTVTNHCSAHANDCVIDPACVVTPLNTMDAKVDCVVEIQYNANAGANWQAHVIPVDSQGEYLDLPDSATAREVPALTAINQTEVKLQYELTAPGQVSPAVETTLTNLGNQPVDVLIGGTDLVSPSGIIPRDSQKWSLKPDFDYDTEGTALVETPVAGGTAEQGCAHVNLPIHDEESKTSPDVPVYWKVLIPKFLKADVYQGSVSFAQVTEECK
jgi:hypothetical protein